ncbi:hypothetical protein BLNAU_18003 [Blattamonas nauphoetae]|uniref:Uncharacterized protein n=1 Tax=Blattamonas nauphoetae TaxID=2049346 RepID=A0ABQ9XA49_9EUKA|nr:hypothetical protein BLNAU_18003 [Blattamonas nauphoetae]
MALEVLSTQSNRTSETRSFLETLIVPSGSTESSSELVPFDERLYSTLAEHVSKMKSLFTEWSASDGTISALSATLPSESSILTRNAVLEVLCEGFSLFTSLLQPDALTFFDFFFYSQFVPLIKSTIIACLDLLDQQKTESNCPSAGRTAQLITVLDCSWNCTADSLSMLTFGANLLPLFANIIRSSSNDHQSHIYSPSICSSLAGRESGSTSDQHIQMHFLVCLLLAIQMHFLVCLLLAIQMHFLVCLLLAIQMHFLVFLLLAIQMHLFVFLLLVVQMVVSQPKRGWVQTVLPVGKAFLVRQQFAPNCIRPSQLSPSIASSILSSHPSARNALPN